MNSRRTTYALWPLNHAKLAAYSSAKGHPNLTVSLNTLLEEALKDVHAPNIPKPAPKPSSKTPYVYDPTKVSYLKPGEY